MFEHGFPKDWSTIKKLIWLRASGAIGAAWHTVTGAIVTFVTNLTKPLRLTAELEPIQSGTGDPSPENMRPISGHTTAVVNVTGKNLMGGIDLANQVQRYMSNATIDTGDKYVSFSASDTTDANTGGIFNIPFKENTRYTIFATVYKASGRSTNLRVYYKGGSYDNLPNVTVGEKSTAVFTTAANKTVSIVTKYNSGGITNLYYDESGIFEGVLTADDFESYQGSTTTITFPDAAGTVYGGTLTVNEDGTGSVVVDSAYLTLDSTLSASNISVETFDTYARVAYSAYNSVGKPATGFVSDVFKDNGTGAGLFCIWHSTVSTAARMFLGLPTTVTTKEEAIAWFTANPTHVVYELATPITIPLTAEQVGQINTLQGTNVVWVDDSNNITVEYQG